MVTLAKRGLLFLLAIALLWLSSPGSAIAESLANRIDRFPDWSHQAQLPAAAGDLVYPDWFAGTWQVTSTLVELVAPLGPQLVAPGYASQRDRQHLPVQFPVRFVRHLPLRADGLPQLQRQVPVVADRAFNGLAIAKAYLGEAAVKFATVPPGDPNRQLIGLASGRELRSQVTGRASSQPTDDRFLASEISRQIFRRPSSIYVNQVEILTDYHRVSDDRLEAKQVTAIYLSPRDPMYFQAGDRPVALYRYRLELERKFSPTATESDWR